MKKSIILLIAVFALMLSGCTTSAGPWRGKVIDTETKQPIEGVAVVAVWYRSHFSVGGPVERFEDARETLTDKDGNFEIPAYEYNAMFRDKTRPEFTMFKPGYGFRVKPEEVNEYEYFLEPGAVVELAKLKTMKERGSMLGRMGRLCGEPRSKVPNFFKLYNDERKNLGFKEVH